MSRYTWSLLKQSKNFHVNIYRRGLTALIISMILSCAMGCGIFYLYLREPEPDFYATSGITPPIKLNPLPEANNLSEALLPPDPQAENEEKKIPQ